MRVGEKEGLPELRGFGERPEEGLTRAGEPQGLKDLRID